MSSSAGCRRPTGSRDFCRIRSPFEWSEVWQVPYLQSLSSSFVQTSLPFPENKKLSQKVKLPMSSSCNNKLCLSLNELEPDLVDVVESVAESVIVKGRLEVVAKSVAVFRKLNSVTLASSVVAKGKGGVWNDPPVFDDVRRMK